MNQLLCPFVKHDENHGDRAYSAGWGPRERLPAGGTAEAHLHKWWSHGPQPRDAQPVGRDLRGESAPDPRVRPRAGLSYPRHSQMWTFQESLPASGPEPSSGPTSVLAWAVTRTL